VSEDRIRQLLENPELALQEWYISVTPTKDPELILTGGGGPSPERIRKAFDEWFARRQDDFRAAICEKPRFAELKDSTKSSGQTAIVGIVASALESTPWGPHISPVATAAVIVSTQALNNLCAGFGSA
jgi:hypothetical protein